MPSTRKPKLEKQVENVNNRSDINTTSGSTDHSWLLGTSSDTGTATVSGGDSPICAQLCRLFEHMSRLFPDTSQPQAGDKFTTVKAEMKIHTLWAMNHEQYSHLRNGQTSEDFRQEYSNLVDSAGHIQNLIQNLTGEAREAQINLFENVKDQVKAIRTELESRIAQARKNNYLRILRRFWVDNVVNSQHNKLDDVKRFRLEGSKFPDNLKIGVLEDLEVPELSKLASNLVEATNTYFGQEENLRVHIESEAIEIRAKELAKKLLDEHEGEFTSKGILPIAQENLVDDIKAEFVKRNPYNTNASNTDREVLVKVMDGRSEIDTEVMVILDTHGNLRKDLDPVISEAVEEKLKSQIHDYPDEWKDPDSSLDSQKWLEQRLKRPFERRDLVQNILQLPTMLKESYRGSDYDAPSIASIDGINRRLIDNQPVTSPTDPTPLGYSYIQAGIRECNGQLTDDDKILRINRQDAFWAGAQLGFELRTAYVDKDKKMMVKRYTNFYQHCVQEWANVTNGSVNLVSSFSGSILDTAVGRRSEPDDFKRVFTVHLKQLQRYKGWSIASGNKQLFQEIHSEYAKYVNIYKQATGMHHLKVSQGEEAIFDLYENTQILQNKAYTAHKDYKYVNNTFGIVNSKLCIDSNMRDKLIGSNRNENFENGKNAQKHVQEIEHSKDDSSRRKAICNLVEASNNLARIREQTELADKFADLRAQMRFNITVINDIRLAVKDPELKKTQDSYTGINTQQFDKWIHDEHYLPDTFYSKKNALDKQTYLTNLQQEIDKMQAIKNKTLEFKEKYLAGVHVEQDILDLYEKPELVDQKFTATKDLCKAAMEISGRVKDKFNGDREKRNQCIGIGAIELNNIYIKITACTAAIKESKDDTSKIAAMVDFVRASKSIPPILERAKQGERFIDLITKRNADILELASSHESDNVKYKSTYDGLSLMRNIYGYGELIHGNRNTVKEDLDDLTHFKTHDEIQRHLEFLQRGADFIQGIKNNIEKYKRLSNNNE